MSENGRVAAIIPVWNLWNLTEACLRSLAEQSRGEDLEVVVVDNHSTDATATELEPLGRALFGEAFQAVRMPENVGFAKGCNAGARAANADRLFFLNNDTTVAPGWLPPLRTAMDAPGVGAVGPLLLYPDGTVQHCGIFFTPFMNVGHLYERLPGTFVGAHRPHPLQAITGAAIVVHRRDFEACGCFHEAYRNGFEDVDLCFALRARGLKLRVESRSVVYHHTSSTPGRFAHDAANSAIVLRRFGASMRPDEHILAALDGYELHIGPTLDTWIAVSDGQQQTLAASLRSAGMDADACRAMLEKEPLWLEGWLLLAARLQRTGDLVAAVDALTRCLRILPDPRVYEQLLALLRQSDVPEAVVAKLEAERTKRDFASSKVYVQQARRSAYKRGDTALARILTDWLVRYRA